MTDPDTLEAAKCLWRGLEDLHLAGNLLTTRNHESIDRMESELYAMVGGHRDCPGCETPTPSVLLDMTPGSGLCPRCEKHEHDATHNQDR